MPIEWDEAMATGVASIDQQHQRLIAGLNELKEALLQGRGDEMVGSLIEFLGQYIDDHFGHEEECFARYRCPHAERNRLAHEYFKQWYARVQQDYALEGPSLKLLVVLDNELMTWFNGHIRGIDKHLRGCADPDK